MDDLHKNGRLVQVWYQMDKFATDPRERKLVKAPFDRLIWAGHTYIQTADCGGGGDGVKQHSGLTGIDGGSWDFNLGRQSNFVVFERDLVEEHFFGDWSGNGDDWKGVFKLGLI